MKKIEAIETIKTGHIAEGLLSYALLYGAKDVVKNKQIWKRTVDDCWEILFNGEASEVDNIPAHSWYIKFNGFPAGIMTVFGEGVLCAGEAGNEENLRQALLSSIETSNQNA